MRLGRIGARTSTLLSQTHIGCLVQDPALTSEYVRQFCTGLQHGDGRHGTNHTLQVISTCKREYRPHSHLA